MLLGPYISLKGYFNNEIFKGSDIYYSLCIIDINNLFSVLDFKRSLIPIKDPPFVFLNKKQTYCREMWFSGLGVTIEALGPMFDSYWANCGILPAIIANF